jgi:hypothetical protein
MATRTSNTLPPDRNITSTTDTVASTLADTRHTLDSSVSERSIDTDNRVFSSMFGALGLKRKRNIHAKTRTAAYTGSLANAETSTVTHPTTNQMNDTEERVLVAQIHALQKQIIEAKTQLRNSRNGTQ